MAVWMWHYLFFLLFLLIWVYILDIKRSFPRCLFPGFGRWPRKGIGKFDVFLRVNLVKRTGWMIKRLDMDFDPIEEESWPFPCVPFGCVGAGPQSGPSALVDRVVDHSEFYAKYHRQPTFWRQYPYEWSPVSTPAVFWNIHSESFSCWVVMVVLMMMMMTMVMMMLVMMMVMMMMKSGWMFAMSKNNSTHKPFQQNIHGFWPAEMPCLPLRPGIRQGTPEALLQLAAGCKFHSANIYIWVYIYIYVYVYINVYMYVYNMYIYIYVCIYIYMYIYILICIYIYIHIIIHIYIFNSLYNMRIVSMFIPIYWHIFCYKL